MWTRILFGSVLLLRTRQVTGTIALRMGSNLFEQTLEKDIFMRTEFAPAKARFIVTEAILNCETAFLVPTMLFPI